MSEAWSIKKKLRFQAVKTPGTRHIIINDVYTNLNTVCQIQNVIQEKHPTFENGWLYLSNSPVRDHAEKFTYVSE